MPLDPEHNATAVLDPSDSLTPDPSPSSASPFGNLFFDPAAARDLLGETTSPSPSDLPSDAESDSAGAWSDPGASPEGTGPRASSADDDLPSTTPQLVSKENLKKTFRAGVQTTGVVAHKVGARTVGQQQVGLYLADDDDARNIGDPLASIAYRRGGISGGKLSPDTNDFMQAVMGVVGYLSKQLQGLGVARTLDQQYAAGVRPEPEAQA